MDLAILDAGPFLDTRKHALDPRTVQFDAVSIALELFVHPDSIPFAAQNWNQVFGSGENEDVRLTEIAILRGADAIAILR